MILHFTDYSKNKIYFLGSFVLLLNADDGDYTHQPHPYCIPLVARIGLGDDWGHRIIKTTNREKELGSQILQVD